MIENNLVSPTAAAVGTVVSKSNPADPKRPAWVSNACDADTAVEDSQKSAVRENNIWGMRRLFAGKDVAELCGALRKEMGKESFWEKIKRSFNGKVGAIRLTDEIALYPPDLRYLGYAGYDGFAYIREAASYSTLVRLPDEMMEDPGLLAKIKAGVARAADELRRSGKVDVVRDFRAAVAT